MLICQNELKWVVGVCPNTLCVYIASCGLKLPHICPHSALSISHTWCDICGSLLIFHPVPAVLALSYFNAPKEYTDPWVTLLYGVTGRQWWWQSELVLRQSQTSASGRFVLSIRQAMHDRAARSLCWPVLAQLLCTCAMFDGVFKGCCCCKTNVPKKDFTWFSTWAKVILFSCILGTAPWNKE